MLPNELYIKNFGPYRGSFYIDFRNKNLIGIQGSTNGNFDKSNRSGKSTFVEALRYIFHGDTKTKKAIDMISFGETELELTGVFQTQDNKTVSITRGLNSKNKSHIEIEGYPLGKRTAAEIIKEDLFPYTAKEFSLLHYANSKSLHSFMDAGATEQTNLFRDWLIDDDKWGLYYSYASEQAKIIQDKIEKLEWEQEHLEIQNVLQLKQLLVKLKDELTEQRSTYSSASKSLSVIDSKITLLLDKINKRNSLKQQLLTIEKSIERIEAIKSKAAKEKVKSIQAKKRLVEINKLIDKIKVTDDVKDLESTLSVIKSKIRDNRNWRKVIETTGTGMCPLLNESCTRISEDVFDSKIDELVPDYDDLSKKIDEVNDIINVKNRLEAEQSRIQYYLENSENNDGDIVNLESQINNFLLEANRLKDQIKLSKDPSNLKNKKTELMIKKDNASDEIDELNKKIIILQKEIETVIKNRKRNQEITKELESLNRELEIYNKVSFTFSKAGIPNQILSSHIYGIQTVTNEILRELDLGLQLNIRMDRELTKLQFHCVNCAYEFGTSQSMKTCPKCKKVRTFERKNELNFEFIIDEVNRRTFESDSGGGQVLISLALRMAIASIRSKYDLKFMVLDEPFIHLDKYNTRMLLNSVVQSTKKRLGVERLFVITHDNSIRDSFDHVLHVDKVGNFSKIGWLK